MLTNRISQLPKNLIKRTLSTTKFTLPDLTYDYGELEPFISAEIMKIHHTKHHQAYVTNLNLATEKLEEALHKKDITQIVALQQNIKFNGGGHINHTIFWKNLAPPKLGGGEAPTGELKTMIDAQYGSLEGLQKAISTASVAVQGSGWGWLGYDKVSILAFLLCLIFLLYVIMFFYRLYMLIVGEQSLSCDHHC
jgi:superoxide dismutase, Fe-Mn family